MLPNGLDRLLAATRGYRLAEIRREVGLSVEEVARRLPVTGDMVLDRERGLIYQAYISPLSASTRTFGGELEVTARFGDEHIVTS